MKRSGLLVGFLLVVLLALIVFPPPIAQAGEPMFWWRISWGGVNEFGDKNTQEEMWAEESTELLQHVFFGISRTSQTFTRIASQDVWRNAWSAGSGDIARVDSIMLSRSFAGAGVFVISRWSYNCFPAPALHISVGHSTATVILRDAPTGSFRWSENENTW